LQKYLDVMLSLKLISPVNLPNVHAYKLTSQGLRALRENLAPRLLLEGIMDVL